MPKFVNNVDLNQNELRKAVIQVLASAPASPVEGQIYYNSGSQTMFVCTVGGGSPAWKDLGKQGTVTSVTGSGAISSTGGTTPQISISAADGSNAGTMSAAHYTLVNNATNANTASTIVKRDASGNFSAGTITAALTGDVLGNVTGNVTGTVSDISNHDTGDLAEGTNLYYTDTRVRANRLDQMTAPTASVSFNSQKITGLADPTDAQDAATKAYVDAARSGLDVKQSVRAATSGNITLSGTQTVDGVSLIATNRVLVKSQTDTSQNGIWVVAAGSWSRAIDADSDAEVTSGLFTFVEEGTDNGNSGFVLTTDNPITVGTTGLTFAQFSGAGQITAGNGLTKSGNTIDAVGTADRISVTSDAIDIASTYAGQTSITTLGTISTGTWSADTIVVGKGGTGATSFTSNGIVYGNTTDALQVTSAGTQYQVLQAGSGGTPTFGALNLAQSAAVTGSLPLTNGGTGATTAATARTALAVPTMYKAAVPSGATTAVVTHALGTTDVSVQVYEVSTGETVFCDVVRYSTNVVNLGFSVAPTSNQYRVIILAVES
jgi:uncharacterized cupin superfamily protein